MPVTGSINPIGKKACYTLFTGQSTRLYWVGPQTGSTWHWSTGTEGQPDYRTNWNADRNATSATIGGWGIPADGDNVQIRKCYDPLVKYGATVTIDANAECDLLCIGYWSTASGHVVVATDITLEVIGGYLGVGDYVPHTQAIPTFTQSDGFVTTDELMLGRTDEDGPGYGHGKYTISGGKLGAWYWGIKNGIYDPAYSGVGKGIFRVVGDTAQVGGSGVPYHEVVRSFKQTNLSKAEFVLTAAGAVTPINCTPRSDFTFDRSKTELDGTAEVDIATNGYTPVIGDKVTLVSVLNGITGYSAEELLIYSELSLVGASALDRTINATITEGYRLTDDGNGAMQVLYTALGDATLDACVTGADYTLYSLGYGTGDSWEEGDFNGDGAVTGADYTLYAAQYGSAPPPGTIPEPITMTLLGIGGLALLRRRRR